MTEEPAGSADGATDAGDLSGVERFLRLFTDIRPGEGPTALILFANVFLILCAYYFIKPLREGWIAISEIAGLERMEVKAYTSFAQSLLLLGVLAIYARLSNAMHRRRLITASTLTCMAVLLAFWFVQPDFLLAHLPGSGVAFYLWVGIFGVFVVAQFWAFAADVYDDDRGRRLIPLVAIGATSGAAFGASIVSPLVATGRFGAYHFLVLANLPLLLSLWLTHWADRRGPTGTGSVQAPTAPAPSAPAMRDSKGALGIVLRNRYLLATAVVTLALNWVNTNGENLLFRVIQENLEAAAAQAGVVDPDLKRSFIQTGTTAFYGDFFTWVNLVALVLQAVVASRLLKYGGFGAMLLLLPVIALGSYITMALLPVLAVVKIMKIAENSTDYSINNTARHVLWLPVAAELKYKGKTTIDSLFTRLGDGLAALTVLVGVQVLALSTQAFFAFTVGLVILWILASVVVVREHTRLVGSGERG